MKKFLIFALCLSLCLSLESDSMKERALSYIGNYSRMAVSEMLRSGVPASITLAQGMLESACGMSELATRANNHFGIKCHSDWDGESVTADDDRKGECFRKYPDPYESFKDHSDFLRYKKRYAFLFDFEREDYKSWAYGLKSAGYATDPEYASKLIHLIEAYDLGRFDSLPEAALSTVPSSPSVLARPERSVKQGRTGTYTVSLSRELFSVNGTNFVYARRGESYRSIAAIYDLSARELAGFNDRKDVDIPLDPGEAVFLAKKAKNGMKGLEKHICSDGESLWEISQRYGVRLKNLMRMNGIKDPSAIMREDDTVLLRQNKKGEK